MTVHAPHTLNTKVYTNSDVTAGTARWVEKSAGYPTGWSVITQRVITPANGSRNYRTKWTMVMPVVSTADSALGPAGTFLRQAAVEVVVTRHNGMSDAEMTDLYLRFVAWFATTPAQNAFKSAEPING